MTKMRKIIIALAVIVGMLSILAVMAILQPDYRFYPKVFYEYKEKGKSTQYNIDDVKKGFK